MFVEQIETISFKTIKKIIKRSVNPYGSFGPSHIKHYLPNKGPTFNFPKKNENRSPLLYIFRVFPEICPFLNYTLYIFINS